MLLIADFSMPSCRPTLRGAGKAVLCQLMCLGVWDEKYLEAPSLVLEICLL